MNAKKSRMRTDFLAEWSAQAQRRLRHILFTDAKDPRVQEAVAILNDKKLAIASVLEDPEQHPQRQACLERLMTERHLNKVEATKSLADPHMLAALLLKLGAVDAVISGPTGTARERILPALQIIRTDEPSHRASGAMVMLLSSNTSDDAANGGVLIFADCALNVEPSTEELAQIALDSAKTARQLGLDPKVALLSFSTAGSTAHPLAQRMKTAAELAKAKDPSLSIEGELQVDAALMDAIGAQKDPGSLIAGHANVLIFPDLEAGNIGYKLVERLAGATAIGPLLQGLQKPVNEVSRGATAQDLVNLAILTSLQCG